MISYKNVKHEIRYKDKNGRKKVHTLHNRLQDNCLDYAIYSMLGITLGNSIFSQFTETGAFREEAIGMIMQNMYIKTNTTQTISDSNTTMDYDYSSLPYIFAGEGSVGTEVIGTGGKSLQVTYANTVIIPDGDQLTGIGFGKVDIADTTYGAALGYTNYLMSFIDLSAANIESDGTGFQYVRVDEITTNEIVMNGSNAYHIPAITSGELQSITVCKEEDGTDDVKTYVTGDLTFTKITAGEVEVTGFDVYSIPGGADLVPLTTLYPANDLLPNSAEGNLVPDDILYPGIDLLPNVGTGAGEKPRSVRFEYSTDYGTVETYLKIKDLDASFNNKEFKIKLKCQRG